MRRPIPKPKKSEGDSWQVIYMDLMTMVMVFFVILWSLNQGKDQGISETVGDTTTRMVNLPGDVLFAPGQTGMSGGGKEVMKSLFGAENGNLITFETNDLVKRMLVIHGHTDSDGDKNKNLNLGYRRALAAYNEIKKYSNGLEDHVIICTHADNSPLEKVAKLKDKSKLTPTQRDSLRKAKAKNRRITIEDKLVNEFEVKP